MISGSCLFEIEQRDSRNAQRRIFANAKNHPAALKISLRKDLLLPHNSAVHIQNNACRDVALEGVGKTLQAIDL
jgi:hypothetical protein